MRITFPSTSLLAAALALSACSTAQPDPTPAPAPVAQAPAPAPAAPTGDWIDWPISKGDWVYRSDARGSIALFGPPNADARFLIRCDQSQKRIFVSQAGSVGSGATMTLRASSGLQAFPAQNSGGAIPYAAVSMAPGEYMLDRIVFSRGRFAVQTTGLPSLAIPIWPEFTRVVEDCRS